MQKKFATMAVSAAVISAIALNLNSANAATFDYTDASVSGNVTIDAFAALAAEQFFGLPFGMIPTTPQSFSFAVPSGSVTVPDDQEQFRDGDITLDSALADSLFPDASSIITNALGLPANAINPTLVSSLDRLFNFNFLGNGTVDSTVAGSTNFNANYDSAQNAVLLTGYDSDVIAGCLEGSCRIDETGEFSISIVLSEVLNLNNELNLGLTDNMLAFISNLQQQEINELLFASGNIAAGVKTTPIPNVGDGEPNNPQSVPEPTTMLGLLGVGGMLLQQRKRLKTA